MAYRTQSEKKREDLQPPQNIDAEKAVLGSILKDDQALDIVLEVFDHDGAFYVPKHRMIFEAMLDLNKRHEPCDITTVAGALADKGQLEGAQGIGGRVYLVDLAEYVASTANVQKHADIILEKFLLRRLIQTTREITRSAYDHNGTVDDILDIAEKNIFLIYQTNNF